jgi:hypothetical protein
MERRVGIQEPAVESAVTGTVASRMLSFLEKLSLDKRLPSGVKVMNPYRDHYAFGLCRSFYAKYYNDNNQRALLLGINPGRFGSGTTGISFTDPVKLERICGITNTLPKKAELSADFIYMMIEAFGGPDVFYRQFLISAVSPLGFIKGGLNINYYDIPALQKSVTPFIVESLNQMLDLGLSREKCFCIGEGKNFVFLDIQNKKYGWFKEVIPLPHPRFIMQYRRKKVTDYVNIYLTTLK